MTQLYSSDPKQLEKRRIEAVRIAKIVKKQIETHTKPEFTVGLFFDDISLKLTLRVVDIESNTVAQLATKIFEHCELLRAAGKQE